MSMHFAGIAADTAGHAPDTLTRPGEWVERAACAGQLDLMFPAQGDADGKTAALALCAACPVRAACLDDALAHEGTRAPGDRHGVIGGLAPYQRWLLAKRLGIPPAPRRYVVRTA